MKSSKPILCAFTLLITIIGAGCVNTTELLSTKLPLNTSEGETWILNEARSDEFSGVQIDYNKWKANPKHVQTWTWNNQQNAMVKDGYLEIQMQYEQHTRSISDPCQQGARVPDSMLFFTSAMLESYATGIFGYYEARIKGVQVFPGFSPAFWMYSEFDDSSTAEGTVRYSEIDVVELQQRQNFKTGNERISDHNLHTALTKKNAKTNATGRSWRRPGKHHEQENVHELDQDPSQVFHVFGARVTEREIIWYVDNDEVGRSENNYWKQLDMKVALSLGLRKPYTEFTCNGFLPVDPSTIDSFNGELFNQTPPSMTVDYVRVWALQ